MHHISSTLTAHLFRLPELVVDGPQSPTPAPLLAGSATRLASALCQRETQSGWGFPDLPLLQSEHYS